MLNVAAKTKTIKKRAIKAEDLYELRVISNVRISPDGSKIIYVEQRVDRKTEKKYQNLWIAPIDGSGEYQFTYGNHSDTLPRWSPNGDKIAFLSNRYDADNPPKLFVIPINGGEAYPLADIEGTISNIVWSPDGKKIACIVNKMDADEKERKQDENLRKLGVVSRHYDRLFYKLDGTGYLPRERAHLWIVNVKSGKAQQITDHPIFDEYQPAWSPDGKSIVFVSNHTLEPDQNPDHDELFIMSAKGEEIHRLDIPIGPKSSPTYSPDGKYIAYIGRIGEGEWYRNNHLWIIPSDGSAESRDILNNKDIDVFASTINDIGSPELMPPTWSLDGEKIYFQTAIHGSTVLKAIWINSGEVETIIDDAGVVASYSFDKDQQYLAYHLGQQHDPAQIYLKDMNNKKSRAITKINRNLLDQINLGKLEEIWFKGPDGNDLQGWILKPPNFKSSKKYPSILEIHGGPLTQYGKFFMHEFYFLAAQGYIVTFCNPRGGRGYGEKHAGAIWGGWGDADFRDLMAWADYVSELPYIDKKRMGVTGGSYGGYMTVWIIGHTNRFKAAVTQRCVSNLVSMWGSSDMNWIFQQILGEQAPFENLEKFWQHSPIAYIGNAKTPTLVIHSENDLRCPIEQGEQVFVALKRLGVETEFVRFPNEFHGLSREGRTDRRVIRLNHIKRWFDTYL